jgi:SAM-dependent methyltransferase
VYGEIARGVLWLVTAPLEGRWALDAGAGTGAVGRALAARGAHVIAVDASESMLRAGAHTGDRDVVLGDVRSVPLRPSAVDIAVAGFVLSHVPDPGGVLAELGRVTVPGGTVLVTAFPADAPQHPTKAAIDDALADAGYIAPPWYVELKETGEPRVGSVGALAELAAGGPFDRSFIHEVDVSLADLEVATVVAWRLGMAHVAPFVSGLDPSARDKLEATCRAAVESVGLHDALPVLALRATVG